MKPGGLLMAVRDSGARLRSFLYHEVQRDGDGPVDLSIDHRIPGRSVVGRAERTSWGRISVRLAQRGPFMNSARLVTRNGELLRSLWPPPPLHTLSRVVAPCHRPPRYVATG